MLGKRLFWQQPRWRWALPAVAAPGATSTAIAVPLPLTVPRLLIIRLHNPLRAVLRRLAAHRPPVAIRPGGRRQLGRPPSHRPCRSHEVR